MFLKIRTNLLNIQSFHILHEHHRMGVSHGYCSHLIDLLLHSQRLTDDLFFSVLHGNVLRMEFRLSHIHFHQSHSAVFHSQIQVLDAAFRIHTDPCLVCEAVIIHIFCHTADAVAAHGALAAVRIVHFHLKIRFL